MKIKLKAVDVRCSSVFAHYSEIAASLLENERVYWDKPSPTITTKFFSISNGRFAHLEENRAISIREGAALQSFPLNHKIKATSIANAARMIGNAVPHKYANAIGKAIIQNQQNE